MQHCLRIVRGGTLRDYQKLSAYEATNKHVYEAIRTLCYLSRNGSQWQSVVPRPVKSAVWSEESCQHSVQFLAERVTSCGQIERKD